MDLTPEQIQAIVEAILSIIGAFAVTASVIPAPKNPALRILKKVIDTVAFNVFKAKNKE